MFNPIIIIAIIIQSIVAKSSRKAGAIVGFVITTGIFLWGISVYGDGGEIALFGISLSEPVFYLVFLVWFGFDIMEFVSSQKGATETGITDTGISESGISESGISPTTITKTRIPAAALVFLWILTNIFANFGWSMLYPFFITLSPATAAIILSLSSGLIAGLLQWLILIVIIPKADRRLLALWIPATMVGWAIIRIMITFVAIPSGMTILISVIRGGTLGVLQ
jgi:hypothetical protein